MKRENWFNNLRLWAELESPINNFEYCSTAHLIGLTQIWWSLLQVRITLYGQLSRVVQAAVLKGPFY